jgi:hypothetical protein
VTNFQVINNKGTIRPSRFQETKARVCIVIACTCHYDEASFPPAFVALSADRSIFQSYMPNAIGTSPLDAIAMRIAN